LSDAPASPIQRHLEALHRRYAGERAGKLADYIPELARANPDHLKLVLLENLLANSAGTVMRLTQEVETLAR
jgi:glutaminase